MQNDGVHGVTEVRFYHLTRNSLEQILPNLLEKTFARGLRAVVLSATEQSAEKLAAHLWSYEETKFLPHGTARDGNAQEQPVWLTAIDERPNEAEILFLTEGQITLNPQHFQRICELFDGNDPEEVKAARLRWKAYKEQGFELSYWQQSDSGWNEMKS